MGPTGFWVVEGTTFVVCDVSKSACTPQTVAATLTVHVVNDGASTVDIGPASLVANPNPIVTLPGQTRGTTTLSWNAPGASVVEVHLNSPTGALFSLSGSTGTATTGPWVTDGMVFYLQDVSQGHPGTTVGTATVYLRHPY